MSRTEREESAGARYVFVLGFEPGEYAGSLILQGFDVYTAPIVAVLPWGPTTGDGYGFKDELEIDARTYETARLEALASVAAELERVAVKTGRADLHSLGFAVRDGRAVKAETAEPPDEADLSWQKVEARCRQVFEKAGCAVYSTSQRRRSRVSAGIPDLIVFGPPGHPFHLYFEVKAGRGRLSEAQHKFALHCERANVRCEAGGEVAARRILKLLLAASRKGAA
jgi:hypothetical protein